MKSKHLELIPVFGARQAWKKDGAELPHVSKQLKLKFVKSSTTDKIGIIKGIFEGHEVLVDIDKQFFNISLSKDAPAILKNIKMNTWQENNKTNSPREFITNNKIFNKYFKFREGPKGTQELFNNDELVTKFMELKKEFNKRLSSIDLDNGSCRFGYNSRGFTESYSSAKDWRYNVAPEFTYIPAYYVSWFVPKAVAWFKDIEKIAGKNI